MALDDLLAVLEREAAAGRDATLAAAREEAARVVEQARARTGAERAAALERIERERLATAERAAAAARWAARRDVLEARDRLLTRVFDGAAAGLPAAAASPAYQGRMPALVGEAMACLGDAPAEVRTEAAGFRVVARDGSVEVDGTLAGALARRRAELAPLVLRALETAS